MEFIVGRSALPTPVPLRPQADARPRVMTDWRPSVRAYRDELRRAVAAIEERRLRERRR